MVSLAFMDKVARVMPTIKGPANPLSLREKMVWTAGVLVIYFMLYSTVAIGVSQQALSQPFLQLISIVFAGKIGSLITVGIGPIVLSSIVLQLLGGSLFKIDMNDPVQKARYQTLQKLAAMVIAVIEAVIYVATGFVPITSPAVFGLVAVQLAIGAVTIVFLDEIMSKYGVMSGINIFIASGVSYSIVAGTFTILIPGALAALNPALGGGGASALPTALLVFGPLLFAIVIFLVSIYAYETKVELPLAFEQLRGIGGRLPIPFLYVSVLPVILASSLELSMTVWFRFLAGVQGNLAKFIALYQGGAGTTPQLSGGLIYLISPQFPSPYPAPYGIGGYGAYFNYLFTSSSQLYLPWGGMVLIPEWIHIIIYTGILVVLCVIFGKFWIEMTGQSPKKMAEQIGDMGWQIPGFRRDPRIIESVLNKYIPTVTVLGSMFVGLLAALATLSGAIGTGMGILLTVGIIYMLYQQLQQDGLFETYPILGKIVK